MLFMKTIKDDVELYSYRLPDGALKGQTYYVLKSDKINSFVHDPNTQIKYVGIKDTDNGFKGELSYLKTIPINQLKMMLVLKPDLRIEDLLDDIHEY